MPYTLKNQVHRHEFGTKTEVAKSVGKRSKEKRVIVLAWLYKWGWCSERVLQHLLGLKRKPSHRLRNSGVIQLVDVPRHLRHLQKYFTVNESTLYEASIAYETIDQVSAPLSYPWTKSMPPVNRLGEHQDFCQILAIDEINRDPGVLACDRELRVTKGSGALPDFQIERSGIVEWHEVELHPKYGESLFHQMESREKARKNGEFSKIVWWCGGLNAAAKVTKALSLPIIPVVHKRPDGKLVRSTTEEGWNPAKLMAASEILVIGSERGCVTKYGTDLAIISDDDDALNSL